MTDSRCLAVSRGVLWVAEARLDSCPASLAQRVRFLEQVPDDPTGIAGTRLADGVAWTVIP